MIETYGGNKVRAEARASILNRDDPGHYSVHQIKGDWCVVPKTRLAEIETEHEPEDVAEPEFFDPRAEWGTMPRLSGRGRGQL